MKGTRYHFYISVFCLTILYSTKIHAQEITIKQTITYINEKLAPRCSIDVIKGVLVTVYKEGGEVMREDQVSIGDLDISSVKFNATENMLTINCKGFPGKKCVTKDLYQVKKSNYFPRTSFEVYLNEKSAEGLKNAFIHLIRLITEPKYKSSEPFE